MEDSGILDLYWDRDERAISETDAKYGRFCYTVAYNILRDGADAEESVNDTYLAAWNAMPPHRPNVLRTFIGKLARRISISRWRHKSAEKRGGSEAELALEELSWCVPDGSRIDERIALSELSAAIDAFLREQPETQRKVFVCRYWYCESVEEIARRFGFSKGKVKSMLFRLREKLASRLSEEGLIDGR